MGSECPHLAAGLVGLEEVVGSLAEGANVTVDRPLLLSNCSIPDGILLNRITVVAGGHLIFNQQDFSLRVREIL
jgi:hypothetical protein